MFADVVSTRRVLPPLAATLAVVGVAAVGACTPAFAPASRIENERIIAIIADPPEASPGQNVALTPIIASPTGTVEDGAGFSARWWRCPDADSDALGDFWECSVPSDRLDLGVGVPYVDTVPTELFGPPPVPGEPLNAASASGKLLGALLGYWRVVGATMVAGERVVDSFKRVPVYLPFPLAQVDARLAAIDVHVDDNGALAPNANPVLTAVLVHEGSVDGPTVEAVKPGQTYFFEPLIDDASLQAFFSLQVDLKGLNLEDPASLEALGVDELLTRFKRQQRCEIPTFNWYVTAGAVRREISLDEGIIARVYDARGVDCPAVEGDVRSAETEFTAPAGDEDDPLPADGVVHAWVVLRDGRGGSAVRAFDLPIAP